ncbi:hypothetical protein Gohar_008931 [Gossypium harknessii]|uniref:Uncharacterized protein n=1 Tax=Gossypium harknessii TaxID=34285 RepID=A0A7J9GML9_9ROSI|nr:hypothetical protein [Gossypium harknessii]
MNIVVGARAGVIDDLFTGNFLGKDYIVFDYRQNRMRSFEYLQGDYYIVPMFLYLSEATTALCFLFSLTI